MLIPRRYFLGGEFVWKFTGLDRGSYFARDLSLAATGARIRSGLWIACVNQICYRDLYDRL
jgi:hypothetical protein